MRGFQWIDGSFVEDVEATRSSPPNDVDVVTFALYSHDDQQLAIAINGIAPRLLNRSWVKASYKVDHFLLSLGSHPQRVVENTTYFHGLFSHTRDGVWKGMLCVDFGDAKEDQDALAELGTTP